MFWGEFVWFLQIISLFGFYRLSEHAFLQIECNWV